jgi:hypothetical protein
MPPVTAIVGLVHDGRVFIGGDSAGVAGYQLTVRADQKVFRTDRYVFGFTDSFRMGQLIRYSFEPPAPPTRLDKFMSTTFVDALRSCLKEGGYARKDSEQESGGTFLVGVAGRLFRIGSDYQVGESVDLYDAVGSGDDLALGALYATPGQPPKERIRIALGAAERFSAGVRRPFVIVATKRG